MSNQWCMHGDRPESFWEALVWFFKNFNTQVEDQEEVQNDVTELPVPRDPPPYSAELERNAFHEPGVILGYDVSHHNGDVDHEVLRSHGYKFGFIKCSEGVGYVDPKFTENWAAMKKAGVIRGAYHFARVSEKGMTAAEDGRREAESFAKFLGPLGVGDLPPVLDIEWDTRATREKGITPDDIVSFCSSFLVRLEELTQRKPIIYTGPNYWRFKMNKTLDFTHHHLWLVDGYRGDINGPKKTIPGWPYTFYQYSNNTQRPDNAKRSMDANIFKGTMKDLRKLAFIPEKQTT